jgi:hypothetical protein
MVMRKNKFHQKPSFIQTLITKFCVTVSHVILQLDGLVMKKKSIKVNLILKKQHLYCRIMPPTRRLTDPRCTCAPQLMTSMCVKAEKVDRQDHNAGDSPDTPHGTGSWSANVHGTAAGQSIDTKHHCCRMLQGLQELRNNDTLCDYSLFAQGKVS